MLGLLLELEDDLALRLPVRLRELDPFRGPDCSGHSPLLPDDRLARELEVGLRRVGHDLDGRRSQAGPENKQFLRLEKL